MGNKFICWFIIVIAFGVFIGFMGLLIYVYIKTDGSFLIH